MHAQPLTLFAAVASLSLALSACGSDSLTLPSEGEAARIAVWEQSSDQSGRVMTELSESLAVRVTDTKDRPVAGVAVGFAVDDGSGSSADPTPVTTSDSGIARTVVTLGPRVGPVTGRAWVIVEEGQTPVETGFTVTALPADANGIVIVSGDPQTGQVGTTLSAPLEVRITDAFGNPIAGVPVSWTAEGGGSVSEATTQTDASGLTSVQRTLGPTAGPQTTSASATGPDGTPVAGSPVIFNHNATAGSAARVIVVDGNGQEAPPNATLPKPLVVQVLDAENNPIVGRAVAWVVGAGEGSVSPPTSNTDEQGRASTQWTLGREPGRNTVSAVVSGVGIGAFTATARSPKTSSSTSIVSHDPEPSAPGQAVVVRVQVTGSGGTPTGTVTVTGENAGAPCTITLANGAGECSLTFNEEGQQRVTATYSGDAAFNGSSDQENHAVLVPNSPPVATADQYSTNEDEQLTVPAPGVLANDADLDSDQLTAVKDTDPLNGTLVLNSNGSFTYTPASNFSGSDSFTYQASDGTERSGPVTVTITVNPTNDAPTTQNDTYTIPGGASQLEVSARGVLANDTDLEGVLLTAQNATDPQLGSVTLRSDGGFTYVPDPGIAAQQDSFTYEASDGESTSTATVTINIQ